MNCAEDPFNMGMFYNSRLHSKWVYIQIPDTHIHFGIGVAPPPDLLAHFAISLFDKRKQSI